MRYGPRAEAALGKREGARHRKARAPVGLDAAALARPAAVVRDRGYVPDRGHREAGGLKGAERRLTAGAGARHLDLERAHAVLARFAGRILGGYLGGIGGRLARALEAH